MKSAQSLSHARRLFALVAILLLASALRARDLSLMFAMVHYDEAYYGVDALSLLEQPRLTPFFPENFGRESLWMYALTPALAAFGSTAFALRITAFFTGVLTVAGVYRLGRELFGVRAGIWAAAVLAVLFWHVVAGHQAFRAHLYPLIGALAFALLLCARRLDTWRAWAWASIAFGALVYTYIAARGWLVLGAGYCVLASLASWRFNFSVFSVPLRFNPKPLFGIVIAIVIAAPLAVELLANPTLAGQRAEQVSIRTVEQLVENLILWARAWFIEGSHDVAYNLPGRPILDLPLVIMVGLGVVVGGVRVVRNSNRQDAKDAKKLTSFLASLASWRFIFILFVISLAPALLTTDTLKPLRAVGVVVPLAILMGAGITTWEFLFKRERGEEIKNAKFSLPLFLFASWISFFPLLLLLWSGVNSARDFSAWVRSPDLYLPMEQHIYAGIETIAANVLPDAPVYFAPFTPAHPVIRLRQAALAPRPISAFEPGECLRLPEVSEAYYFALTLFDPGFADRLRPYADIETAVTEQSGTPRWTIYRAQADAALFTEAGVIFGERIAVRVQGAPTQIAASASVSLTVFMRAVVPLDRAYTLFVHLYGDPTPYEGGELWGQADAPLCTSSPPQTWRTDEVIIQLVTLTIAPELPSGLYTLAIGIYDTLTGERLTIAAGDTYALAGGVTSP